MTIHATRLRLPAGHVTPHHAAFLIEDALRTTIGDTNRLIIVRRMAVGGIGPMAQMARNVDLAWRDIQAVACHASSDSASAANAVWFHDQAEAQDLLLRRLLRGAQAQAWFWALALPDWGGCSAVEWVAATLSTLATSCANNDHIALVQTALTLGADDFAQQLVAYLIDSPTAPHGEMRTYDPGRLHADDRNEEQTDYKPGDQNHDPVLPYLEEYAAIIDHVIRIMPPILCTALRTLHRAVPSAAIAPILYATLYRSYPVLRLFQDHADYIVKALWARLLHPSATPFPIFDASAQRKQKWNKKIATEQDQEISDTWVAQTQPASRDHSGSSIQEISHSIEADTSAVASAARTRLPELSLPPDAWQEEQHTKAAGIFLIIRPLQHLGWRQWIIAHADPARAQICADPTAALCVAILRHHRVADDDPAMLYWQMRCNADVSQIRHDSLNLWRIGLDRWLRRYTGMNLHHLLHRTGWIAARDAALHIRFPAAGAVIGLRRHALDSDPGWVDWLGLSVRYHFSDRPIWAGGMV